MKIQCGVCDKDEATVYCVPDEAALCEACDRSVHHANKLAEKHQRFTLLQPSSPKETPLCDICQERRAFLFCQQDRAILCRECDMPIHKANEHTKKHDRFLLTGVKLSATSAVYSSSPSPAASATSLSDAVPTFNPQSSTKKPVSLSYQQLASKPKAIITPTTAQAQGIATATAAAAAAAVASDHHKDGDGQGQLISGSTSSISEYLMEMLPGWQVEDFLDPSSPNGFCKTSEDDVRLFWDGDLGQNLYSFSAAAENTTLCVPQVPPPVIPTPNQTYPSSGTPFGAQVSLKDVTNTKPSRKLSDDNSFAVPQISSLSSGLKRSYFAIF